MNSWHVRCWWCGLREIENAGEASPYLDIKIKILESGVETLVFCKSSHTGF